MNLTRSLAALVLAVGWLAAAPAFAQKPAPAPVAPTNDDCLACHGDPGATGANGRSVAVSPEKYAASIHGQIGQACVDCHKDLATVKDFPHAERLAPVNCASCHEGPGKAYDTSVHAEARRASKESVAAACKDCHGTHDIRPVKDPDSPVHHLNLPNTCGKCHGSEEIIKKGRIAIGNVVAQFQDSIHGQALSRSGLVTAPNCSDCHDSHAIKRKSDPTSRVFRTTVPATCGKCHEGIERRYAAGVHGTAVSKGNPEAPTCVNCHSAHQIRRTEADSWKLQVLRECGSCHKESVRTYRDTFHGQVTQLGFVRVATCADCHGAHDIFPKSDPRSSVSQARLLGTCQKCHQGASAGFTKYDPHADRENRARNPLLFYAAKFMEWLLIGVFAFFGLHTVLWFSRSVPVGRGRSGAAGE